MDNYTILIKSTLNQLNENQIVIGSSFSLICSLLFFLIGNLGNILLFIKIKHFKLISNKLHLINLIINNLLVLNVVLPSNLIRLFTSKNRSNDFNENDDYDQNDKHIETKLKKLMSMYGQLVRAENCEIESTLTLIVFYCHLFNFLLFFINHKKCILKTKDFYSNFYQLKKEIVLNNFSINHKKTAELNDQSKLDRALAKQPFDHKFTGETINEVILIRIRNFVFCFLTAWLFTFILAVLNDLSDEQFSVCAIKCRLCAFWFKELILTDYDYMNAFNATTNERLIVYPTEISAHTTTDGDLSFPNKNESVFEKQINNEMITNHLNDLILKVKHFRSLPAFRYMILLIQLLIIFIDTLLAIINLTNTFFRNRTYRVVPQCYVIETNCLNTKAVYYNESLCDKQVNSCEESNSSNLLNNKTEEEAIVSEKTDRSTNSIKKPKKLGKLKNERNLLSNVEQIIKLTDDTESAKKEAIKVSKDESNYENLQKIYNNLSEIEKRQNKSAEMNSKNESNLPVAREAIDSNKIAYYHQCSSERISTNYLDYLNSQQQKSNNNLKSNYYPENTRIISTELLWRSHTTQHLEQRDFATIFIRIYFFFLLTWIPLSLTLITTQLFTFSWKVDEFNLRSFSHDARVSFRPLEPDQYKFESNFDTFQQNSSDVTSTIGFNGYNVSATNPTGSIDRRRTILLEKLKNFKEFQFINKLWFLTLIYSTFSAFFFRIISRQWLANLAQQKVNNLIHFIKSH